MSSHPVTGFHATGRRRRIASLVVCLVVFVVLTGVSLFTVLGQNLDNLSMESLIVRGSVIPDEINFLTSLVSIPAIIVVAIVVVLVTLARRRPALALRALAVVGGANITTQLLKAVLERPDLGVGIALENSYPSGHTTFAASVAAALVLVAPRGFRSTAAMFGWVWTSLMGVVVITQGWHRPSDVLGAILVVAIWSYLLAPVEERPRSVPNLPRVGLVVAWALLVVGVAIFIVALSLVGNPIQVPLSRAEMAFLVLPSSPAGPWFALAATIVPTGLGAIVMNGLDRLSGEFRSS